MSKASQPVFTVRSGLTVFPLATYMAECGLEFATWISENRHKPPEIARTSIPAYKVAMIHELIFKGRVATQDFSNQIASQNGGNFDIDNYNTACEEVRVFLYKHDQR